MRKANNRLLTLYVTKSDRRRLGHIFKAVHKLHRSSFSLEYYLAYKVKELLAVIGRFSLTFLIIYIVSWLPVIPSIFISEQEGFIRDNWVTISATLLSVGVAIYLGMIVLIPLGIGKGNEIFGVKRFDIFWHQPLGNSFYNNTIFYEFTLAFAFLFVSYFIGNIFLQATAFLLHLLLSLLFLSRVIRFAKLTDFEVFANYLIGRGFARNRCSREIMEIG